MYSFRMQQAVAISTLGDLKEENQNRIRKKIVDAIDLQRQAIKLVRN